MVWTGDCDNLVQYPCSGIPHEYCGGRFEGGECAGSTGSKVTMTIDVVEGQNYYIQLMTSGRDIWTDETGEVTIQVSECVKRCP